MKLLNKFWHDFKTRPDVWFFYGFLLTFTLSIRKVLSFYPISGQFNEYAGIYLYLSDIFLTLALISWLISILCNKNNNLSIYKSLFNTSNKPLIFLPLLLVAWSFTSIFWSQNTTIAIFRSSKLLELYLIYIYIFFNFPLLGKDRLERIFKIIIFLALFQAIIAILQFVLQHSIALFWLKESLISPNLPGVAKIIFNAHKFIRSYGLFPHPNILGGFLLFSLVISLSYKRLFHSYLNEKCSTWNIDNPKLLKLFIFIQIVALILTFSKSAILGFFIALLFIYLKKKNNVPHLFCEMFHVEHLFQNTKLIRQAIIILLIIILVFLLLKPDIYSFFIKSLGERETYIRVALNSIAFHPLVGIGIGQFVLNMQNYAQYQLEAWQFQPVHNVFFLIWAELGIIGLLIFIAFLWGLIEAKTCHPEPTLRSSKIDETTIYPKSIFLAFIFIMLFDHYLWDIQQGQVLFWLTIGFVISLDCKKG